MHAARHTGLNKTMKNNVNEDDVHCSVSRIRYWRIVQNSSRQIDSVKSSKIQQSKTCFHSQHQRLLQFRNLGLKINNLDLNRCLREILRGKSIRFHSAEVNDCDCVLNENISDSSTFETLTESFHHGHSQIKKKKK